MKNQNKGTNQSRKFAGYGGAIGLVIGWLVGFLIQNPIIFAGGGLVLGVAVGTAVDQRRET